jgi:hypothetical protein
MEKRVMMSLRSVYDRYFAEVFGFVETARYHLDGIAPDLPNATRNSTCIPSPMRRAK